MLRKLLVVYNTCGIARRPHVQNYIRSIQSILDQDFDDFEVVMSSCLNHADDITRVQEVFDKKISYNIVNEQVPVSITFNNAILKSIEKFGNFEGYVFVDSGIDFEQQTKVLKQMYDLFKSGPYGMVAARTDDDMGLNDWFKTDMRGDSLFSDDHLVIEVGMAVNLHVQIFSNKLVSYYGRCLPDIFAGQCMESVFSFLCAALKTKWVVHKDIVLHHKTGMDGPSSGFQPHVWQAMGKNRWDHMFSTNESILDIIGRGAPYGMGYEEIQQIAMHDPEKFNDSGFSLDDRLKDYIKHNMFLSEDQFAYKSMNQEFV